MHSAEEPIVPIGGRTPAYYKDINRRYQFPAGVCASRVLMSCQVYVNRLKKHDDPKLLMVQSLDLFTIPAYASRPNFLCRPYLLRAVKHGMLQRKYEGIDTETALADKLELP